MTQDNLANLYYFYGYWEVTVCTFAFVALLSIWQHITKEQAFKTRDLGLLWLSIAVLTWTFDGFLSIYYANNISIEAEFNKATYEGFKSILSLLNSAFILLALPRFKHAPKLIRPILQSDSWRLLVIITFSFSLILTLLMLLGVMVPKRITFIYSVDFVYAIFTLFFLGLVIWGSFDKRDLKVLAYLSAICIACTLAAQLFKLGGSEFWKVFLNCTFKTILIMLFFALALSWIEELSKARYLPKASDMHAIFVKKKNGVNKFAYLTILTIPPQIQTQKIAFTEKPFELLLKFAEKKKAEGPQGGWLEIQPKSAKNKIYDIKDYNEISRILDNILNEIHGPSQWETTQKKALKEILFEYGNNRRIRLRIPPQNLTIEQPKTQASIAAKGPD